MMHIITLPLVNHSAQLPDRSAHHSETGHRHLAQAARAHRKLAPVARTNNSATRSARVWEHDVRTPQPRRNRVAGHPYVRAENIAERSTLVLKEHYAIVLAATDLETVLAGPNEKRITVAKQTSLHSRHTKLYARNLTLVHEGTLRTLELTTRLKTVLVNRRVWG